ncbi:hypothetical protein DM01DRAFT_1339869 [Hesseltinella vesiculosa]|uniref:Uncharacterized protein n=1 Tax=Hesseltinella vesiculosa TaxID=101127 RepID=A0A1X2G607_9FUNG|nr:hypothetical protein DM01DRAFT_1339869 [Hesseltinella vesiculosa]
MPAYFYRTKSDEWNIFDAIKSYKTDNANLPLQSVCHLLKEDLPSVKKAAEAIRPNIDLLCGYTTGSTIHASKLAESINKINKVTQNNYVPSTPTPTRSSSAGKRKQTYDVQSNPIHVKKNKKSFVFNPPTLTPSISVNKPNIDDVDAALLDDHYYAKLADSHVVDGVHSCAETDAEYAQNMDDQCANRSFGSLKIAMKFLPAAGYDEIPLCLVNNFQATPSVCCPSYWR